MKIRIDFEFCILALNLKFWKIIFEFSIVLEMRKVKS